MPINVFGSTSQNVENETDWFFFVQKTCFRTNYKETEESIDLKNQKEIENLPSPLFPQDAAWNAYVDNKFNDLSIIKNSAHVDFNDENVDKVRLVNNVKYNIFQI